MKPHIFFTLPILLLVLSLGAPNASPAADDYWPDAQWRAATPEGQGMRSEILADMLERLWRKNHGLDSILIVRNGYVVLDTYHFPKIPDRKHDLYSCTKSVSSTLIGIAIDKGYIQSVDQPLLGFFPDKVPPQPDKRKQQITLEDALQMTTGLDCRDSIFYQWAGLMELRGSEDWVRYMLDLPVRESPGSRFNYCNGASFLLTAIIQEATGQSGLAFAREHLFDPLGIYDVDWPANSQGQTIGWGRLQMRPRDMARFGYLFLKGGRWKGRQVVSAQWIEEATRHHIPVDPGVGYGYQWWVLPSGDFAAIGYGGQRIYVLKEKQMVVVFTGRLTKLTRFLPNGILRRYIMAAVQSDQPLPENKAALNRLKAADRFWQTADHVDRDKRLQALSGPPSGPRWKRHEDRQIGYSLSYEADLGDSGLTPAPPVVFQRSGLTGFPVLTVIHDDIQKGWKLEDSEAYLARQIGRRRGISDIQVAHKEMVQLPDGTEFNYCKLKLKYLGFNFIAYGRVGVHKKKIVGAYAIGGGLQAPFAHLEHMVRSLRFDSPEP